MARVVNAIKIIKETRGTINTLYDASYKNIMDIVYSSSGRFDLACNAFTFGYAQGMKAAKAEMKKAVK